MKSSISKKLIFGINGLIIFFLLFSLIMNYFFLEKFYIYKTKKILLETAKLIDKYNMADENFIYKLDTLEKTKGFRIFIISSNFEKIIEIRREQNWRMGKNIDEKMPRRRMVQRFKEIIINSIEELENKKYILHFRVEPEGNIKNVEIIYKLINGDYLSISKPVVAIIESADIASKFFIISGIITLFLSSIFGFFFSEKFTKPIKDLNNIAHAMTNMDFSKRYIGRSKDEIGELGDSLNILANKLDETITELREANEKLKAEVEQEKRLEKMRKEFIAGVSHELKTPVSLIQGYAEGLKLNINEDIENKNFYCDVIIDEADKMGKMINELLNLAKLEYENSELKTETFDICNVINILLDKYKIKFDEKNINLFVNIGEKILINANREKIEQVISNYINNAINHCEGEKKIIIETEEKENYVKFNIYNTGKNIPKESINRIWESFYKIDESRSREYGGTGLGLSIVKAIIEKHKGEYGVYNKEDGVVFWFKLFK